MIIARATSPLIDQWRVPSGDTVKLQLERAKHAVKMSSFILFVGKLLFVADPAAKTNGAVNGFPFNPSYAKIEHCLFED